MKEGDAKDCEEASAPQTDSPPKKFQYYNVGVATFYGLISASAIVVNKGVMTSWGFNFPLTMILCQMVFSFALLYVLKFFRCIDCPSWSYETAKKAWPVAWSHALNVLLGLIALNLVNIPMFATLRRLGALFVMTLEYFILNRIASYGVISSVVVMVIGALVAGWSDLTFDLFGYSLTLFVNLTTAVSLVVIPKVTESSKLNAFGLMLYQITLSFPIILIAAIFAGEFPQVIDFPDLLDFSFLQLFIFSCAQIFLLNYSMFLCTQVNSPLTTTITGNLKNILQTIAGFILFTVPIVPLNLVGITIGLMGSIGYSVVKYREKGKG